MTDITKTNKEARISTKRNAIIDSLQYAGLNDSQIKVYLYLLEEGVSTPPQIAKGTKIARTNCYNILRELDDLDLVDRKRNKARFIYIAQNPNSILRAMDKKRDNISKILPELFDIYKIQKNKPTVEYYDGLDQVEDIFLQTLNSTEEILSVESTKLLYKIDQKFFLDYDKELRRKQIFTRDILSPDSGTGYAASVKAIQGAYYKYRRMPAGAKNFASQILIWNNNVAHIAFEQPYFGTIMRSEAIASAMRSLFEMAWESAPEPTE
jgi:sugar-specific transcriptional regulator TrmB